MLLHTVASYKKRIYEAKVDQNWTLASKNIKLLMSKCQSQMSRNGQHTTKHSLNKLVCDVKIPIKIFFSQCGAGIGIQEGVRIFGCPLNGNNIRREMWRSIDCFRLASERA